MSNEERFEIPIPSDVRSEIIESVENGDFPDWFYPKTLDEPLDEYVASRRGRFDAIGFEVFHKADIMSPHHDTPVETPPEPLLAEIQKERRAVFRENYTLRFEFADESWDEVTDLWLEAYYVITEPTDL